MLKHKLVTGAYLIVIFISICGMLKMIFGAPPRRSTFTTTVAHDATSPPSVLPTSRTLGPEPTPEPTQSTRTTAVATAATSPPSILPISGTPEPEPTPESTKPTLTETAHPTPTPKPLKSRVVKHQPNQFRKGALSKVELSAINKAMRTIQWSRNPDPQAAAHEDYAAIAKECEKNSVRDLLADLITEAASNDYQPGNEAANSIYSAALISKFETRVKDEGEEKKPETQRH
jgi:hypothetical protein